MRATRQPDGSQVLVNVFQRGVTLNFEIQPKLRQVCGLCSDIEHLFLEERTLLQGCHSLFAFCEMFGS
jgi:hypothetical protein